MRKLALLFLTLLFWGLSALAAVDINRASESELESLPGVGAATAHAIIAARPFHSVDDLKNVKGIGAARFAKMAPLVSLGEAEKTAPTANSNMPPQAPAAASSKLHQGERVNINSASLQELERLPGIGPKKAEAIIQSRPFQAPEDIMKVKGIKKGIFAKIKDNISVN